MAEKKTLKSAPGPSEIGALSGDKKVESVKGSIAAAVAAAAKENANQRKARIAAADAKAKETSTVKEVATDRTC